MIGRIFAASTARNRDPILDAYAASMPVSGTVLEIASGAGEHAVHIAGALPMLRWLPGDPDADARASIAAWTAHAGLSNIAPPHAIDAAAEGWEAEVGVVDAIVCINMIHIAPFAAAEGLFAGAGRLLPRGGRLFLYGPFSRQGRHSAPSNADFDSSLKARDARWGVRDLDNDLLPLAERAGLALSRVIEMPANNLSVVFER
jgi:cyclopropane fatty-acyl-phospholipid synthase-like methyltransferase